MRVLVDLQCVQSTSAARGIGRYALSLAHALVEVAAPRDQVEVLLNSGDDPVRLMRARTALEGFLPAKAIHVFDAPWPWHHRQSEQRRTDAEAARAAAVTSLRPDALLIGSVFEGDGENVLSVEPGGLPTAAVLYDLIPAADPGTYLLGPGAEQYWRRWEHLKRVDLLLAISEYSGQQARELVGEQCPPVIPVWGGPYPSGLFEPFETRDVGPAPDLPERYLLAVGGDHPRKNLDRLVQAWSAVPPSVRSGCALVIACRLNVGTRRRLLRLAGRFGLQAEELVLTGEVSEPVLAHLYEQAVGFVFPSTEEGLGLPPLEAMAAGCPTVLARGSSLSELVDDPRAYFDGLSTADISRALRQIVEDDELRDALRTIAATTAARFTWARTGRLAWDALHTLSGLRPTAPLPESPAPVHAADDLHRQPRPVLIDAELPEVRVPAELMAEEAALGIQSPTPDGLRAVLAPATALVVPDENWARALLQAGLLEQPVLTDIAQLGVASAHDLYAALRARLPEPHFPRDLVRALAHPPRWMLQRPWPVWLVLDDLGTTSDEVSQLAQDAGLVLAVAGTEAGWLASYADHVLVPARLLEELIDELHRARRCGALVTVLAGRGPSWAGTAADLAEALTTRPRAATTGWPWGD